MRIAVVSDIHGNLPALDAVLADIAREGVDVTVNLGDIASGPLWPDETCTRLMALSLPTIRGNHERQVLGDPASMSLTDAQTRSRLGAAALRWLAAQPERLTLAGGSVLCVHGTPASDLHYLLETVTPDFGQHGSSGVRAAGVQEIAERLGDVGAASLVLCGHTHMPRVAQIGPVLVVNPGSVGLPAFDDTHPHRHVVETGSPHARWALVERRAHGWQGHLCLTAYDWEAAAAQAESLGRGDWADALRSGFVGRFEGDGAAP
jgi:putative phosphoesterase